LARHRLRFLRLEYAPTIVLILAFALMASLADQGVFELIYAVAGLFSFISAATGLAVFFQLRNSNLTAARLALTTGIIFFILLFALGEYLFALYFPG
jgi:hypothetical protein